MKLEGEIRCREQRRLKLVGIAVAVTSLLLSSCSTVSVKIVKGSVTRSGIASAQDLRDMPLGSVPVSSLRSFGDTSAELLRQARRENSTGRPEEAAACYLKVAVGAHEQISQGNLGSTELSRESLIDLHNHSLARFAELWANGLQDRNEFQCHGEIFAVEVSSGSDFATNFFDRAVATESVRGEGVISKEREGLGAPLVGIRDNTPERAAEMEFVAEGGLHLAVTLTISGVQPAGSDAAARKVISISLLDPTQQESVSIGGKTYPLAADFSAPMEMVLRGRNEILWGLSGFFDARDSAETSGIFLMEPYDPDRIPVILTHGLLSVPIIWRDVVPELLSEPEIAQRYQIFAFTYPSSYPISESAQLFRSELARMREKYDPEGIDPLSRNMVAMGHSMGGILTHLLAAEMNGFLWDEIATVPIEELKVDEEKREFLRGLTYFVADPAVQRAVYLSTPHGGAEMATLSLADVVSRLAKLPTDLLKVTAEIAKGPPVEGLKVDIRKKITSVQSLRPDSPTVLALQKAPYKEGVQYHSIIGDRGKGDSPNSSDGVVDYWSSHQEGAASELIVPTGHSSYEDPGAIEELKRILRLHAGI